MADIIGFGTGQNIEEIHKEQERVEKAYNDWFSKAYLKMLNHVEISKEEREEALSIMRESGNYHKNYEDFLGITEEHKQAVIKRIDESCARHIQKMEETYKEELNNCPEFPYMKCQYLLELMILGLKKMATGYTDGDKALFNEGLNQRDYFNNMFSDCFDKYFEKSYHMKQYIPLFIEEEDKEHISVATYSKVPILECIKQETERLRIIITQLQNPSNDETEKINFCREKYRMDRFYRNYMVHIGLLDELP